jgi:tRNA/tmRNA/rRNA uracil-C5-methylase (TrmA/RlmC/RlmD family)
MKSVTAASTAFIVACCHILCLHSPSFRPALAFSSCGTLTRRRSPHRLTNLQLSSWFDNDDYQDRSKGKQSSTFTARARGGERTESAERSRTRRTGGTKNDDNDWETSKPNTEQQQKKKLPQKRLTVFSRGGEQFSQPPSSIDCPHFGTCPGCVVNTNIQDIDVIESAKLYFSSQSVQKHVILHNRNDRKTYFHEQQDEFYKVIIPSSITSWRTQAKLAVAPTSTWSRSSGATIGLYARHSHDVLSIPECKVHHPTINRAVEIIVEATKKVRTPIYLEDTGEGLLRYIQLQVELSTGKVCLTLIMNAQKLKDCQPHLSFLVKELKRMDEKREVWHSIWCHCNDSGGNAIFARESSRWHPVDGPPFICEKIPGSDPDVKEGLLYFSPMVFRQGNFEGFREIAREVREAIPDGSKVCEMYAGVGLLGLSSLLYHGKRKADGRTGRGLKWLRCSDENPENQRCFELAVSSMPMHITGRTPKSFESKNGGKTGGDKQWRGKNQQSRRNRETSMKDLVDNMVSSNTNDDMSTSKDPSVTYTVANAASALFQGQALGADVLIVDPPRKGLEEPVLQQLCQPRNPKQPYVENANMISHLPRHTINWVNDVGTVIYVSCGFDALARDCDRLLTSNAGWKMESVTGYVLFPGSNHVESVVVFRR